MSAALFAASLFVGAAWAQVAPECQNVKVPEDYDEQVQADFLNNYTALALSFSPIHDPVPHDGGRGAIGLDLAIIPYLDCPQRFVLNGTKTENTNKTPVVPRPRATFGFRPIADRLYPYAGVGFVPPLPVAGTRNMIFSGEFGVGAPVGERLELGFRVHGTLQHTIGEVAEPFTEDEPAVEDLYLASTMGGDAMFGVDMGIVTPYAAVGWVDVDTFFWVGEDGYVGNNYHPYLGPAFSLGVDSLIQDRLRLGAEFYGAPGGYSLPDVTVDSVDQASRYGKIYTGRLRLAYEL